MASKSQIFTSNGNWTAPAGVSAVIFAGCGGGSGAPGAGDTFNDNGSTGGGGSAELVMGMMIPVTPGQTYGIVIGAGGLGSPHNTYPERGGSSSFNSHKALGAGVWSKNCFDGSGGHTVCTLGPDEAGSGGGAGGSTGLSSGGGFDPKGRRESNHWTGGAGGGGGGAVLADDLFGTLGGISGEKGVPGPNGVGGNPTFAGGPGAGTIFGGTNGADGNGGKASAASNHYGAGAGGTGEPATAIFVDGGNGAGGVIILTWCE